MRVLTCFIALSFLAAAVPAGAEELDALNKAVETNPEDPNAYDAYAKAALKANRFDDVIHKVKIGVARIPSYSQGYYWLAFAYRKKKEWADAADYYRRYITLNPAKTDPYFGLAASLEGLGDNKGAIAAYDKYVALEKAPDKQRFVEMAKAELIKLDPSRAPPPPPPPPKPVVVATLPSNPPPPSAPPSAEAGQLRLAAEQLQRDGKLDEAVGAYQRALAADGNNVELYNSLGNVYFALKRYPEAARAFRDAVSRDALYALGWYNLAHAYRKGDQKQQAVDAYRQYMRLKPDDPDPYYGLGQTLKALGDISGAVDAFRKYVAMEKRPDEQRWVEKARAELSALEAMQKATPQARPNERIEDKGAGDELMDRTNRELQRDLGRDRVRADPHDDLMDPFNARSPHWRSLRNPFQDGGGEGVADPFASPSSSDEAAPKVPVARRALREYGAALEAYRHALSRQAEEVSQSYERGVAFVMADDAGAAIRAWNVARLDDTRVDAARKSVERVRSMLASRK
ncbi:MAG TPA: tetratricopeptide repeat protein [Polyangia bacterium]|nr:tetratricopeptide repeat protein [Polyangia bacterium]